MGLKQMLLDLYKDYARKWVALDNKDTSVITSGNSLYEVIGKLKKIKGINLENITLKYILPVDGSYSPYANN